MQGILAQRIQPAVQDALRTCEVRALREIAVASRGNSLQLSGCVSSFYHKQLAQELVRTVCEGVEVVNAIEVRERKKPASSN